MQRLGQHFLKNTSVLKKAVELLDVEKKDFIIEIGPGKGALTMPLHTSAAHADATLIVIEKDSSLAHTLKTSITEATSDNFNIIEGDALKIVPQLIAERASKKSDFHYKIIGNIPYYITGKLFRILGELDPRPAKTILLIQEEVAERVVAKAGDMNRLAASVQFWATPVLAVRVPRDDFSPPPKVDSALIELVPKSPEIKDSQIYYSAVRALFSQPRKTILNNISASLKESFKDKAYATKILNELGIDPSARAESLSISQITSIAQKMGTYSLAPGGD